MEMCNFLDIGREIEAQGGRSTGVGVRPLREEVEGELALIDLDEISPALRLAEPSSSTIALPSLALFLQTAQQSALSPQWLLKLHRI